MDWCVLMAPSVTHTAAHALAGEDGEIHSIEGTGILDSGA